MPSFLPLVFLLFAVSAGEHACNEPEGMDDDTVLLQTNTEKSSAPATGAMKSASFSALESATATASETQKVSMIRKAGAEFVAMTLFVFIGCGSAMSIAKAEGSAWVLQVSLTFGFAIMVLAYAIGHYSGGQINLAVSIGLAAIGHITPLQALCNILAQLVGSLCGSGLTRLIFSPESDCTGGLGTNAVNREKFTSWQALLAEIVGTFILVYTVCETAVNPETHANRVIACFAIGISVFLAHSVLIPIDGCSINPSRTIGPAIMRYLSTKPATDEKGEEDLSYLKDLWIFIVGPIIGALLAALIYKLFAA